MRHVVLIDSRDRDFEAYPWSNEYKVRLPSTFYNVTTARLASAEIPRSFHTFSASLGNTSFDVRIGEQTFSVTIDDGTYSSTTMKGALEASLEAATDITFTADFSPTTGLCTISNQSNTEFELGTPETGNPTDFGLLFYLGFDVGRVYPSTGARLISSRPASFHGVSYILLDIEELRGAVEAGMFGSEVGSRPLAKIPMDPGAQGMAMLDASKCMFDAITLSPPVARLRELRIRFRYHDGRLVDFRGADHSFALVLETKDVESTTPAVASAPSPSPEPATPGFNEYTQHKLPKEGFVAHSVMPPGETGRAFPAEKIMIGVGVLVAGAVVYWWMSRR